MGSSEEDNATHLDGETLSRTLLQVKNFDTLLRCTICYDYFETCMMTQCSHNFCAACIRHHLVSKNRCPTCFAPVQGGEVKPNRLVDDMKESFFSFRKDMFHLFTNVKPDVESKTQFENLMNLFKTEAPEHRSYDEKIPRGFTEDRTDHDLDFLQRVRDMGTTLRNLIQFSRNVSVAVDLAERNTNNDAVVTESNDDDEELTNCLSSLNNVLDSGSIVASTSSAANSSTSRQNSSSSSSSLTLERMSSSLVEAASLFEQNASTLRCEFPDIIARQNSHYNSPTAVHSDIDRPDGINNAATETVVVEHADGDNKRFLPECSSAAAPKKPSPRPKTVIGSESWKKQITAALNTAKKRSGGENAIPQKKPIAIMDMSRCTDEYCKTNCDSVNKEFVLNKDVPAGDSAVAPAGKLSSDLINNKQNAASTAAATTNGGSNAYFVYTDSDESDDDGDNGAAAVSANRPTTSFWNNAVFDSSDDDDDGPNPNDENSSSGANDAIITLPVKKFATYRDAFDQFEAFKSERLNYTTSSSNAETTTTTNSFLRKAEIITNDIDNNINRKPVCDSGKKRRIENDNETNGFVLVSYSDSDSDSDDNDSDSIYSTEDEFERTIVTETMNRRPLSEISRSDMFGVVDETFGYAIIPCRLCGLYVNCTDTGSHAFECEGLDRDARRDEQISSAEIASSSVSSEEIERNIASLDILPRQPLPTLHFQLMCTSQLLKKCQLFGLGTAGNVRNLRARLRRFMVIYNIECDLENPRPVRDIIRQVQEEEADARDRLTFQLPILPMGYDNMQYLRENKQSYDKLIKDIRQRSDKVPATTGTGTTKSAQNEAPMESIVTAKEENAEISKTTYDSDRFEATYDPYSFQSNSFQSTYDPSSFEHTYSPNGLVARIRRRIQKYSPEALKQRAIANGERLAADYAKSFEAKSLQKAGVSSLTPSDHIPNTSNFNHDNSRITKRASEGQRQFSGNKTAATSTITNSTMTSGLSCTSGGTSASDSTIDDLSFVDGPSTSSLHYVPSRPKSRLPSAATADPSTSRLSSASTIPSTSGLYSITDGPSTSGLSSATTGSSTSGLYSITDGGRSTSGLSSATDGRSTSRLSSATDGPSTSGLYSITDGPSTSGLSSAINGPSTSGSSYTNINIATVVTRPSAKVVHKNAHTCYNNRYTMISKTLDTTVHNLLRELRKAKQIADFCTVNGRPCHECATQHSKLEHILSKLVVVPTKRLKRIHSNTEKEMKKCKLTTEDTKNEGTAAVSSAQNIAATENEQSDNKEIDVIVGDESEERIE